MVIFHSYVKLPEGEFRYTSVTYPMSTKAIFFGRQYVNI